MATVVIMPRQGQSVESCVITSWAKKVGDPVHTGETLFSYETDKAAFDEEAKVDGTYSRGGSRAHGRTTHCSHSGCRCIPSG